MVRDKEESSVHAEVFEAAGQRLLLEGTSGPSKLSQVVAEGSPVFHALVIGGRTLSLRGTSGLSRYPQYVAHGRPSHQLMAVSRARAEINPPQAGREQPFVISGSAGVYPKKSRQAALLMVCGLDVDRMERRRQRRRTKTVFSTTWDGWGNGTFDLRFPFGQGTINRHSRVVCSISELGGPPNGPLDWRFLGAANMQVLNIAPTDDGDVLVRVNIDWGSTLQWRMTFFIDT